MVVTCLVARQISGFNDGLLLAFVIIAQTAGAAAWLRKVVRNWRQAAA